MLKSFTLLVALIACFALSADSVAAQKNKKPAPVTKKGKAVDAKAAAKSAKDKKIDSKKTSTADKRDKNKKDDKSSKDKTATAKNPKDKAAKDKKAKITAAEREAASRAAAERRRQAAIEAERQAAARRAAQEAARRREQARREAVARARAFETGLRTETVQNIAEDDTRGEDMVIRQAAINALGNKAGTVVVMDAQNGQIVTAVNQKWAYGQGYKPCSTIKLVTGAAGRNEKVINNFGNVSHKPHRLDLTDALAFSNNDYFQRVGGAVGFDKMSSYARELGLGEKTGINAPDESAGKLPAPKSGFALNRMSSHGDDFEVTPLQLATMVSAVTNGGKLIQPQIARTPQEADKLRVKVRRDLNISDDAVQSLLPGMMGAVNYGTAKRANDPTLNIGGKTGSCIGQGSWLGLFASVAPVANPKYAVVVITRGQAERGKWASAVAGRVYQALAPRLRALQPLIANSPNKIDPKPQPKIDPRTAAELSDEENAEESESEDANLAVGTQTVAPQTNEPLVKKTAEIKSVGSAPRGKKGDYTPKQTVIVVPRRSDTDAPLVKPTVKVRPRIVNN